ncbi:EF-hand domain-containing protein [Streptomyces sp. NA04227]|uniref:EF-hand domain-containing protein n=1 Tax=Streptomyces sp. NA04227 TaxID=2742136 RepID=UPI001591DCF7|nr:EF-hand domain-containing protein [Streptomyces sp. NA04227]QKW05730.1 EF-hand domain-containing protein [Streptomyces sp. NA04227]
MNNEFFARKMDLRFDTFDADKDGVISRDDFVRMGSRVLEAFGLAADSPKGRAVLDGGDRFWENLAGAADTDLDGTLTREEFRRGATELLRGTPQGFAQTARPWTEAVIAAADTDDDGRLSSDEYSGMLRAMGADEEAVRNIASHVTDPNNSVSTDAVLRAALSFYTNDKPAAPAT